MSTKTAIEIYNSIQPLVNGIEIVPDCYGEGIILPHEEHVGGLALCVNEDTNDYQVGEFALCVNQYGDYQVEFMNQSVVYSDFQEAKDHFIKLAK